MKAYSSIVLLVVILLTQCGKKEPDTSLVQFSFSNKEEAANARITEEILSKLIISVESGTGQVLVEDHEINISEFGTGYISEPFLVEIGEYAITKFLVLNSDDEIIYATPKKGSALAGLVENPLPVEFVVLADQITEIELEVIETASHDPEDLGYSTFSFSIVPTQEILISVMNQLANGSYEFTNSELTVYMDGDSSFTTALGDSINVVKLRNNIDEVFMKFNSENDRVHQVLLDSDTLDYYRKVPLLIVFKYSVDIESDLVAYYPFDGSANDLSGNNLNGSAQGAALSTDRNDNANSAYEFTGNNDVITVPHDDLLNIVDSLTLSAWVNLYSGNSWGSRIIDKAIRGSANGYLLDIFNPDNSSRTIRFIGREGFLNISEEEVSLNEWNHVAATYKQGLVKIYLNGVLVNVTQEEENQLLTNTEMLEIGNDKYGAGQDLYDPFRGKIDEVRIYNRALSDDEILELMEF